VASPPEVTLRDRLAVLRRRKGTLVLSVVVAVGLSAGLSLLQTPVYEASARLLLQPRTTESLFDQGAALRLDPARAVRNEIEVFRSEAVKDAVRAELGSAPDVGVAPVGDTDVVAVRAESTDPQRAARVANTYAEAFIAFRQRQAVEDLQSAGEEVQSKVDDLQGQIDALDRQVADAPAAEREARRAALAQQRQALVSTQALFRQRLDQIQVEAPLKSGGAQLVSRAAVPAEPFAPRPVRNGALAAVIGLLAGVGLASLRHHFDDSLSTKDDLEEATGLPTVGVVPYAATSQPRGGGAAPPVALTEPSSPVAEAYRTLRTSLQFLSLDRPVRRLMVTSPSAGEGKTTTVANLAVVLARAGVPVVVVCCDLRRPRAHELFGLSNAVGFTSVLLGEATLDQALQPVEGVDRLRVLASGPLPPNPSELLSLRRASQVLTEAGAGGAIVLIDCPPVLPVTDALVLARIVDAAVLVCVAGVTARTEARRAAELLAQVDAPVVGTVLNGATGEDGYGYGYGYGGYGPAPAPSRREVAKR
jgi:polysaccharide biosynthesis transport protein